MNGYQQIKMTILAWVLMAVAPAQELGDGSFEQWRSHVTPAKDELAWREIPWRTTLWDAVVEGQSREKPVLLWAMNGHPLACT